MKFILLYSPIFIHLYIIPPLSYLPFLFFLERFTDSKINVQKARDHIKINVLRLVNEIKRRGTAWKEFQLERWLN